MVTKISAKKLERKSRTDGLEKTVGNTPLLPLRKICSQLSGSVQVLAKAEWLNPSGSVKDRAALSILRDALTQGAFEKGQRLLDSTSGNMGIAYATLGKRLGIPVSLTIPANASEERLRILRALGVEFIETDPLEGSDGALRVAREMAEQHPEKYYYANQYNNAANWRAHYRTTGPEIWQQSEGRVSHFVAGVGTSGTMMGTARYLQEQNPAIQIIAVQPEAAFHGLEGLKHMPTTQEPGFFDASLPDETVEISTEAAQEMTLRLAQREGLFVGTSSGAAGLAACQVAETLESGVVVTVFPDGGYKYLSEAYWEEVSEPATDT